MSEMSEWMPIETAPLEVTEVLLYTPIVGIYTGRRFGINLEAWITRDGVVNNYSPTHWMPLPAPPLPDATPEETPDERKDGK